MESLPVVDWKPPTETPKVMTGETEVFWIAVETRRVNQESKVYVFDAQYVNKPLIYEADDELKEDPISEYLVDDSGSPIEAVGWYSSKEHHEFSEYYVPLSFNEQYKLLGWATYGKPIFP